MNTVAVQCVTVLTGTVSNSPNNPNRLATESYRFDNSYNAVPTSATVPLINQILDKSYTTFTLGTTASTNIDLTTGEIDPLGDNISGTAAFAKVKILILEHHTTSPATAGIGIFGAATSAFVGPFANSTITMTLLPGQQLKLESPTAAGWSVDATHKLLMLRNIDTAQCNYKLLILGTK